jgi:hypothetical protein
MDKRQYAIGKKRKKIGNLKNCPLSIVNYLLKIILPKYCPCRRARVLRDQLSQT